MTTSQNFIERGIRAVRSDAKDRLNTAKSKLTRCVNYGTGIGCKDAHDDVKIYNSLPDYLKQSIERYYIEEYQQVFINHDLAPEIPE